MGNSTSVNVTRVVPYDEEAPPINQEPSNPQPLSEIIIHIIKDKFLVRT